MDKPYAVSADRLRIMFHGLMAVKLPPGLAFADYDHIAAILNVAHAAGRTSAESAWHPVSDAPTKDGCYDVCYPPSCVSVATFMYVSGVGARWICHDGYRPDHPTHWRERPAPPTDNLPFTPGPAGDTA